MNWGLILNAFIKGDTLESFFETLKNLGAARLAMMLATLFGLIIFFIIIAMRSSTPGMTLLYNELSTSDVTAISAKLDASSIPYRMGEDGSSITVHRKEVGRARMLLAEEGLPSGASIGYDIFDKKQSFGTTSFVQNINRLRALEGELARTISTLDMIRNARVHLVLPERELFSRDSTDATASVFLDIRNRAPITPEQIASIRNLVSSSVPQLKATNVSVIDSQGNLLASGGDKSAGIGGVNSADLMRIKYEDKLRKSIEELISQFVGFGKVRATVTADLDFDTITTNLETYDPEGQVVRSTQTISSEDMDRDGGNANVSVENNLPGLPGEAGNGGAQSNNSRTEEITNYEISKKIESIVRESGEVKKLSIAVLVDGKYETVEIANAEGDKKEVKNYSPRTEAELEQISKLIKSAVGFDEKRGDSLEVANLQFTSVDFNELPNDPDMLLGFERTDLLNVAETASLSLVGILVILLVLRPLVNHLTNAANSSASNDGQLQLEGGEDRPLLAGPNGEQIPYTPTQFDADGVPLPTSELEESINMSKVQGRVKASSLEKVVELADTHPGETVSVIRNWMTQEG